MNPATTLLLASALALGLAACATGGPVADPRADHVGASSGPRVYGEISVSTDHVRTR